MRAGAVANAGGRVTMWETPDETPTGRQRPMPHRWLLETM
jgi:hypothetical protein